MQKTINFPKKAQKAARYFVAILLSNLVFYIIFFSPSAPEVQSNKLEIPPNYQITILPLKIRVANLSDSFPLEASLIDEHQNLKIKHAIILEKKCDEEALSSFSEGKWNEAALFKLAIPSAQFKSLTATAPTLQAIPLIPSNLEKQYLQPRIKYEIIF